MSNRHRCVACGRFVPSDPAYPWMPRYWLGDQYPYCLGDYLTAYAEMAAAGKVGIGA